LSAHHCAHPNRSRTLISPSPQDQGRAPVVRVIKAVLQALALGAALWVLVWTAQPNWRTIVAARLTLQWGWLALASLLWLGSFAFLVRLWAASLTWWQQRLGALAALRVFVLSNLARYIPGAVWQFAGLAALAVEAGISPIAVTGAVLVQQLVLLATGLLLSIAFAPALLGPAATTLPPWAILAIATIALALFPPVWRRVAPLISRRVPLPSPPWPSLARYVLGTALGWVGYGLAFWLFGRALLGGAAPMLLLAATAFIASYVAGIMAVFAPGGILVREAALVAALGSHIGADRAFLLAVSARLWLIALEIIGALAVIAGQGLRSTKTN